MSCFSCSKTQAKGCHINAISVPCRALHSASSPMLCCPVSLLHELGALMLACPLPGFTTIAPHNMCLWAISQRHVQAALHCSTLVSLHNHPAVFSSPGSVAECYQLPVGAGQPVHRGAFDNMRYCWFCEVRPGAGCLRIWCTHIHCVWLCYVCACMWHLSSVLHVGTCPA